MSKRHIPKKIFSALLLLLVVYSFTVPKSSEHIKFVSSQDSTMSPLAMYGEYLYNDEKCNSCHTLVTDEYSGAINLDGLGGKYSDMWHFYHLQDPPTMVPNSGMPSFAYLTTNPMDKGLFTQIVAAKVGNKTQNDLELLWQQMNAEEDTMLVGLQANKVPARKNTEILAVIAYLQQIPASPAKTKRDSLKKDSL